jgi:hypothetical protein
MAERFRIDLGYPSLFGSLSYDGTGITDGVVVYDISTQKLFYTGSYGGSGGGGGGTINTGSFLVDATVNSNTLTFTRGNNTSFNLVVATGSSTTSTDNYWQLIDNKIVNSGSLNVIVTSSLTIDQFTNDDIFIIKRQGVPKVKVNSQGVFTLMPTGSFPTAVTGGIIYKDNEYYFGFL